MSKLATIVPLSVLVLIAIILVAPINWNQMLPKGESPSSQVQEELPGNSVKKGIAPIEAAPLNRTAAPKAQSSIRMEISADNPAWLLTNGAWKAVDMPGWGVVEEGYIASIDRPQYGRRARITTDSGFAILKQRGIGGTVTVYVDGALKVTKKLLNDGTLYEIPIFDHFIGWHTIEIRFSTSNELDGLIISKDAQVKQPVSTKKKLLVIGHSYVEGAGSTDVGNKSFVALLEDKLNMETVNQGIGSSDIDVDSVTETKPTNALVRIKDDVVSEKPDFILIVYGLNVMSKTFIEHKLTPKKYEADYSKFLKEIRAGLPDTPIFVSGIITVSAWNDAQLKPINDAIRNASKSIPGAAYIDLSGHWNASNFSKYLSADHVHPSDAGHAFLANQYASVISAYQNEKHQ